LGGAFDIVVDPAIIVEKKRKKMHKKKVEKQIEENEEEEFDFENQFDSEDEQAGLVKWCAEEEFIRGKPRSVDTLQELDGLANQNNSPDQVHVVAKELPKQMKRKNFAAPAQPQLVTKKDYCISPTFERVNLVTRGSKSRPVLYKVIY
jgi:hypothetical protein